MKSGSLLNNQYFMESKSFFSVAHMNIEQKQHCHISVYWLAFLTGSLYTMALFKSLYLYIYIYIYIHTFIYVYYTHIFVSNTDRYIYICVFFIYTYNWGYTRISSPPTNDTRVSPSGVPPVGCNAFSSWEERLGQAESWSRPSRELVKGTL